MLGGKGVRPELTRTGLRRKVPNNECRKWHAKDVSKTSFTSSGTQFVVENQHATIAKETKQGRRRAYGAWHTADCRNVVMVLLGKLALPQQAEFEPPTVAHV